MTTDVKYRPIAPRAIQRGHVIRATNGPTTIEGPVVDDGIIVGLSIMGTGQSVLGLSYRGFTFEAKLREAFDSTPSVADRNGRPIRPGVYVSAPWRHGGHKVLSIDVNRRRVTYDNRGNRDQDFAEDLEVYTGPEASR